MFKKVKRLVLRKREGEKVGLKVRIMRKIVGKKIYQHVGTGRNSFHFIIFNQIELKAEEEKV